VVGGVGPDIARTRKFRNIGAGRTKVSLVVDDLVSIERVGMVGPGLYSRITPKVSWSWNLAGEPAGERWYDAQRTVHKP
jgi:pyridoxamine 5'-phosphate oxidase family protein